MISNLNNFSKSPAIKTLPPSAKSILCKQHISITSSKKPLFINGFKAFLFLCVGYISLSPKSFAEIDLGIIKQIESSSNPNAFNKKDHDGLGSRGLFQISDGLRRDYNRITKSNIQPDQLFDAEINTRIAKWCFSFYYPLILKKTLGLPVTNKALLTCHNAGCGNVKKGNFPIHYINKYQKLGGVL